MWCACVCDDVVCTDDGVSAEGWKALLALKDNNTLEVLDLRGSCVLGCMVCVVVTCGVCVVQSTRHSATTAQWQWAMRWQQGT